MTYDYDMIVIGAGSGGLTAAIGGAGIGAKVLLIEGSKLGGDCTHYGCVPSKALIKAANIFHGSQNCEKFGLENSDQEKKQRADIRKVLEKVRDIIDDVEERFEDIEHIRSLGVDVEMGFAKFEDLHTVLVNGKAKTAKKIVIATGARPIDLPIPGLTECAPKNNRNIFEPADFSSLLIIGSGPIGCELGQAFARLGIKVTIVTKDTRALGREEEKVSKIIEESLRSDDIELVTNVEITKAYCQDGLKHLNAKDADSGEEYMLSADEILVAVGRKPNVENLGLEEIGIEFDEWKGISVNAKTQTKIPHIYAVGDVATKWKFTHYANHMGKTMLAHAIFRLPFAKVEEEAIPRATFTAPEVGSIGVVYDSLTEEERENYYVFDKEFSHVDRAITDRAENGFIRLIADQKGMIKGATIVGPSAGELVNEVALAMKGGISITQLSDTIHAYPTYGYGLRNCADGFRAMSYTKEKRNLVKKIFGLRGR